MEFKDWQGSVWRVPCVNDLHVPRFLYKSQCMQCAFEAGKGSK